MCYKINIKNNNNNTRINIEDPKIKKKKFR